jgi:Predicted oxidoreductases (related to aryl-alcohol dehydrogenases)
MGPSDGSIEEPLTVLAELQRQGLIRHIGLSNITPKQWAQGRPSPGSCACRMPTTWPTGTMTASSMISPREASPMCRSSRWAASPVAVVDARRRRGLAAGHADAAGAGVASPALAQYSADSLEHRPSRISARISGLQRSRSRAKSLAISMHCDDKAPPNECSNRYRINQARIVLVTRSGASA